MQPVAIFHVTGSCSASQNIKWIMFILTVVTKTAKHIVAIVIVYIVKPLLITSMNLIMFLILEHCNSSLYSA